MLSVLPLGIPAGNVVTFVVVVMVLVSAVTFSMMLYDYRQYLEDHKRKFSYTDFLRREQYHLYLLLFFCLLLMADLWMHYLR